MVLELQQLGSTLADALPDGALRVDGIYLHVPFCFHKCHYCDFYSIVDSDHRQEAFVARLEEELRLVGARVEEEIATVFVGGGTPTLLEADLLARMLEALRRNLPLSSAVEWTVEANPETVDASIARVLAEAGVTRVSVGCQSFRPALLAMLERHHDPANVHRAVAHLRESGIQAINLDLIHGVPSSTLADWKQDLEDALAFAPEHLSCYGLQYEPNTPMTRKLELGRIERLDEETEALMYEHTCARLSEAGFEHYEISNWARPSEACRHNLVYWRSGNWLAFGPSASGHIDGTRWKNTPRLNEWLTNGPWTPIIDLERLDESTCVGEQLMLELRLREGIDKERVEQLLRRSDPEGRRRRAIGEGLAGGLLIDTGVRLCLSDRGVLLSDSLLSELV